MAIDTENKRRSTIGVLPVPASSIGAIERKVAWHIYPLLVQLTVSELSHVVFRDVSLAPIFRDEAAPPYMRDVSLPPTYRT